MQKHSLTDLPNPMSRRRLDMGTPSRTTNRAECEKIAVASLEINPIYF